ncbi:cathepsin L-like [Ptychodera flava]|uniref:cathepsin L-like n=1 Tax=Ptychodera flava TaxID=63121 RepID=UPI003969D1A3
MKTFICLILVAVATALPNPAWEAWKQLHGKSYSSAEESVRQLIWEKNMQKIETHNFEYEMGMHTYTLGMNKYGDLEHREFLDIACGYIPSNRTGKSISYLSPANVNLPDTVDWRDQGYVTEVKDQGKCGSCWAFSTTGSLEGQNFKKTGKLVSLSEQQLVDCSKQYGNEGCRGGLMDNAFRYIAAVGGIESEEDYPYTGVDGYCKFDASKVVAGDTGYIDLPTEDEDKLKEAVATIGPISVAIDASHESFQLYRTGVYSEIMCSRTKLDHGVLAVGYGTLDGQDYWLVKNSWGETWGEDGYVMMSRNKRNQCGIATQASYPLV